MLIRRRRRTFSNFYKFTRVMRNMRYNNLDEEDKFADYKMKDTFKINSRRGIMNDNKFLLNDEITDYKYK